LYELIERLKLRGCANGLSLSGSLRFGYAGALPPDEPDILSLNERCFQQGRDSDVAPFA